MSNLRHGYANTSTYNIWRTMKARCSNPNHMQWENYGGRGIRYCIRWELFENFLEDMGERPEGSTIDRIDNDKNYTPENCRWSTQREQQNNRSNNRLLTYKGETLTMAQWARRLGINYKRLSRRINDGWSVEEALTSPKRVNQYDE